MASLFKKVATSFRRPVPPPETIKKDEAVTTIAQTQGLADGLMRKSGVPPQYREEMRQYVVDAILDGRKLTVRNTDQQLFNMLAGHTCVKDWVKKAFEEYEKNTSALDEDTKTIKRKTLFNGIAILLGEGFNIVQEPNPNTKKPFFERDSQGKIIGILNTAPGQPNARFAECDKAIRAGEPLLLGGKRRRTRKHHRRGGKSLRRRKLH